MLNTFHQDSIMCLNTSESIWCHNANRDLILQSCWSAKLAPHFEPFPIVLNSQQRLGDLVLPWRLRGNGLSVDVTVVCAFQASALCGASSVFQTSRGVIFFFLFLRSLLWRSGAISFKPRSHISLQFFQKSSVMFQLISANRVSNVPECFSNERLDSDGLHNKLWVSLGCLFPQSWKSSGALIGIIFYLSASWNPSPQHGWWKPHFCSVVNIWGVSGIPCKIFVGKQSGGQTLVDRVQLGRRHNNTEKFLLKTNSRLLGFHWWVLNEILLCRTSILLYSFGSVRRFWAWWFFWPRRSNWRISTEISDDG